MKKIQYNGSSKILNGIVTKVNLIIDKLVVDVKVNGTSVVVVNEDGEREADIDLSLADQNVKQSPTTDNKDYRVLLSKSDNDTEETDIARKNTDFKYNPSTGNLQTTKLNGNTVPSGSGNDTLAKTSDIPDLSNYVQKSLTVGLIKNDGTIDQTQYATMSDIPDELADLADDENHRLVTDSEISAWNGKAETSDITSAINDLDVASTSIGAGETLATIKEENGKIAVTKQNIKINQGQVDNTCIVGTQSAISGSVTWHKFASTTITGVNTDCIIMLAVNDTYIPDTDSASDTNGGILYCRVRQANPVGTFAYAKLKFVANSGLDARSFRLYYTINSNGITFELWTSLTRQYAYRRFTIINQGQRTVAYANNAFNLSNSTSPTSAPTESATCVRVECEDNTYKQTDNNLLGAKNLIPINTTEKSHTQNNVQFTLNEDGSIKAHITGTGNGGQFDVTTKTDKNLILPNGTYIFSGCPSGGSSSTYRCRVRVYNITTGTESSYGFETGSGLTITVNETEGKGIIEIACLIYSGYNGSDLLFKPMIRPSSIADDTYTPPAQTNRQLTISKADYRDIATVETTNTASQAYSVGDYMIWNGELYRVTQAIASGGTITLNTNVYSTSIGDQLRWKASSVSANEIQVKTTNTNIASGNASEIVIEEIRLYADSGVINNWFSCYRHIPLYNAVGYYKDCEFSWWDGNDSYYASISIIKSGNYIVATCDAAKKGSRDITTYSDFKMYITVSEKS